MVGGVRKYERDEGKEAPIRSCCHLARNDEGRHLLGWAWGWWRKELRSFFFQRRVGVRGGDRGEGGLTCCPQQIWRTERYANTSTNNALAVTKYLTRKLWVHARTLVIECIGYRCDKYFLWLREVLNLFN